VNCGCGFYKLNGWVNIDERGYPDSLADLVVHVPPLPYADATVDEIYGGHFFEHLDQVEAADFLDECWRVLVPGGKLGLMVPDTREVMRRYILDEPAPVEFPAGHQRDLRDLDDCCAVIVFSTDQSSHHQWAYDQATLSRTLERAGFVVDGEFDRFSDPRLSTGQWYQFGLDAHKPEAV
jgi:predicted SAM-dependent methyltransferase